MLFVEDDTTSDDARDAQLGSLASKLKEVPRDFPFVTKLFMVLIPVLLAIGYLTYAQVRGGITISTTPPTTPRLEQGLVGHWTFDGGDMISSTTVRDLSSSNATGTLVSTSVERGRIGQGMRFGSTAASQMAISLNETGKTYTFSVWAKLSSANGYFFDANTGRLVLDFGVNAPLARSLSFYDGSWKSIGAANSIPLDEWVHLVWVLDNTAAIAYGYIDGALQGTTTYIGKNITSAMRIGNHFAASDTPTAGVLDDIRIYNRTLSIDEIRELYDTGSINNLNSSASQPQGIGNLDSGLVGYWGMDEGSGTSSMDSSTNGNTGTLTGGPTWTSGQVGGAVSFDGTDDYLTMGDISVLDFDRTNPFSVSFWISVRTIASQIILSKQGSIAPNTGYFIAVSATGQLRIALRNTITTNEIDTSTSEVVFPDSSWRHVVVTYNGSSNASGVKMYVSALERPQTVSVNNLTASMGNSMPFQLSGRNGANVPINASLDEVRVYNRVLSEDEVSALYRLTVPTEVDSDLKGYWSFNGTDINATTAYDRSGAGNTGALSGVVLSSGRLGQGVLFDGVNDYISIPYNANLNQTAAVTLGAWIKTTASGRRDIINRQSGSGPYNGYNLLLGDDYHGCSGGSSGKLGFFMGSGPGMTLCSDTAVNDGNWHFTVATYDGATARLYIDGVLNTSATMSNGLNNTSNGVYIGRSNSAGWFDGLIDEVRIYGRALSQEEILALYDAGTANKLNSGTSQPQGLGNLDSGLAGYFRFDEGNGMTVTDSITGYSGTVSGSPTWGVGQVGGALDFNGGSVSIAAGTEILDASQNVTISAWVYPDTVGAYRGLVWKTAACDEGQSKYLLELDVSTKPQFWMGGSQTGNSTSISAGQWSHLVVTNNALGYNFYINGVKTASGAALPAPTSSSADWRMSYCNPLDGKLDEVRIYNRALSQEEVGLLYRLTGPTEVESDLKGYWSFNGPDMLSSTTVADRSGAGNNGMLTGGPTKAIGKIGQGLSFDGVDDYINVGSSTALRPSLPLTFSLWVKPASVSIASGVLGFRETFNHNGYWLATASDGSIAISYGDNSNCDPSSRRTKASPASVLSAGKWQHIVGVIRGATDMSMYINGVDVGGIYTGSGSGMSYGSSSFLRIGSVGGTGGCPVSYFGGQIDEVRLYDRAFTPVDVTTLYLQSR